MTFARIGMAMRAESQPGHGWICLADGIVVHGRPRAFIGDFIQGSIEQRWRLRAQVNLRPDNRQLSDVSDGMHDGIAEKLSLSSEESKRNCALCGADAQPVPVSFVLRVIRLLYKGTICPHRSGSFPCALGCVAVW